MSEPPLEPIRPRSRRQWWKLLGWSLAVVLLVTGLAAVATLVVFVNAMNSFGSNK
jgi:disulfide bond formation protein DsbB